MTDRAWFDFLRVRAPNEVNFWQPTATTEFRALSPGQPLLFKLHSPDNYIVGGGFFAHFSRIPVSLAWSAFGERNGAPSFQEMQRRIAKYRGKVLDIREDYVIGCIILQEPFFLDRVNWLPVPVDFSPNIVRFKGYDLTGETGRMTTSNELDYLIVSLRAFARERDLQRFHDPKNLAMCLASEAGELLSELRWVSGADADEFCREAAPRSRIAAELGDIGIAWLKLEGNALKYPVGSSWGKAEPPA